MQKFLLWITLFCQIINYTTAAELNEPLNVSSTLRPLVVKNTSTTNSKPAFEWITTDTEIARGGFNSNVSKTEQNLAHLRHSFQNSNYSFSPNSFLWTLDDIGLFEIKCNNNGTKYDPADDYIEFYLNPSGSDLSATYSVSVSGGTVTGNYYFSNDPTKPSGSNTDAQRYNISQLMPNMAYTVRIPNVTGGSKQAALGVNTLTTANAGGGTPGTQADVRDSDGTLTGSNAEATVVTTDIPTSGANNHNFDFGFSPAPPPTCSVSLTAAAGACVPATNQDTLTGSITFTNPPATGTLTVQITGGGSQVFNAPFTSPQAYSITGQTSDGASHTVTATFSADNACTNSATYTAPVNCSSVNCPQKRCGTVTVKKN